MQTISGRSGTAQSVGSYGKPSVCASTATTARFGSHSPVRPRAGHVIARGSGCGRGDSNPYALSGTGT
jgi:hypothetical protein